jgi:hypothetical protein
MKLLPVPQGRDQAVPMPAHPVATAQPQEQGSVEPIERRRTRPVAAARVFAHFQF